MGLSYSHPEKSAEGGQHSELLRTAHQQIAEQLGGLSLGAHEGQPTSEVGGYDILRLLSPSKHDSAPFNSITGSRLYADVYHSDAKNRWTSPLSHPVLPMSYSEAFLEYVEDPQQAKEAIQRTLRYMKARAARERVEAVDTEDESPLQQVIKDAENIRANAKEVAHNLQQYLEINNPNFVQRFVDQTDAVVAIGLELSHFKLGSALEDLGVVDAESTIAPRVLGRYFIHLINGDGDVYIDPLEDFVAYQLAYNSYDQLEGID